VARQLQLKNRGNFDIKVYETSMTLEMSQMFEDLKVILTEHGIIKESGEKSKEAIELILTTAMNLQNKLISQGSQNMSSHALT
jgi:hypothetical protein